MVFVVEFSANGRSCRNIVLVRTSRKRRNAQTCHKQFVAHVAAQRVVAAHEHAAVSDWENPAGCVFSALCERTALDFHDNCFHGVTYVVHFNSGYCYGGPTCTFKIKLRKLRIGIGHEYDRHAEFFTRHRHPKQCFVTANALWQMRDRERITWRHDVPFFLH